MKTYSVGLHGEALHHGIESINGLVCPGLLLGRAGSGLVAAIGKAESAAAADGRGLDRVDGALGSRGAFLRRLCGSLVRQWKRCCRGIKRE